MRLSGKNLVFIRSDGIFKCLMLHDVIFCTSLREAFHTLLELVWINTLCLKSTLIQ